MSDAPRCPACGDELSGFFIGDNAVLQCPECGPVGFVNDVTGRQEAHSFFEQGAFTTVRRPKADEPPSRK